nr:MAG TPA: hypothetical protein [Caudoviricetes sp.]
MNNLTNIIHIIAVDNSDQNRLFNVTVGTFSIVQNGNSTVHSVLNTINDVLGMLSYDHNLHLLMLRVNSIDYTAVNKDG